MTIYPTIFTDSVSTVQERLNLINQTDSLRITQVDVIDGNFADEITVAPLDLATIDFGEVKCDLHLMVDEPMDFVYEAESVAKQLPVRAVIAQIERMSYQNSYIEEVRQQDWQVGLSLDIFTPLEEIDEESWRTIHILQLMGNEAGQEGQALHPHLIPKLKEAVQYIKNQHLSIEVMIDIGVKPDTLPQLAAAGATGFAVGKSTIWSAADPVNIMNELSRLSSHPPEFSA